MLKYFQIFFKDWMKKAQLLGASLVIVFSFLAIMGWVFQKSNWLVSANNPHYIQFSTSIALFLCAVNLILMHTSSYRLLRLFILLALAISLLGSFENIFKITFHINEHLLNFFSIHNHLPISSMAPNSAFCLTMISLAELISLFPQLKKRLFYVATLGSMALAIALVVLIGHFSGLEAAYRWSKDLQMSFIGGISYSILGFSLMLWSWNLLEKSFQKWFSPTFYFPIILSILLISLSLWSALRAEKKINNNFDAHTDSNFLKQAIKELMIKQVGALERMAYRWQVRSNMPKSEWTQDTKLFLKYQSGLREIDWVSSYYNIYWQITDQFKVEPLKLEPSDYLFIDKIKKFKKPLFSKHPRLENNQPVFFLFYPIYKKNEFKGFFISHYNFQKFLKKFIDSLTLDSFNLIIWIENVQVYPNNPLIKASSYQIIRKENFDSFGLNWEVTLTKNYDNPYEFLTYLPLIIGIIVSLLIWRISHYGFKAQEKSRILAETLSRLKETQNRLIHQEKLASLGFIIAAIAHEIKNPLSLITMFSELCQKCLVELEAEALIKNENYLDLKENIGQIHEQAIRANSIIQRMLSHASYKKK